MKIHEIVRAVEAWVPKAVADDKDNIGLQIGDENRDVSSILVALELTDGVIEEALEHNVGLIVTHHPLIHRPLSSIHCSDAIGRKVLTLIQQGIALYSAHTNLDFVNGGISFTLAEKLGLRDIKFLVKQTGNLKKIAVFIPVDFVEKVVDAMSLGGAGAIGEYDKCSFRTIGTGTFRPSHDAKPFVGRAGQLETVQEVKVEMIAPSWTVSEVVRRMLEAHPYEEVAYDVFGLENENASFGCGAVGNLESEILLGDFMETLKLTLAIPFLKYVGDIACKIRRVAVCGGSGSKLLSAAVQQKADVFITGDISYHTFHDALGKICLIDAGHFETEQFGVQLLVDHLKTVVSGVYPTVDIFQTQKATNPIGYL
jgi:dinuclear metal center YbgI/SA1388 family protein